VSVQVASSGLLPLVERGLYLTLPRRGVIHVGANDGAEIQWYLDRDLSPILCFEPNPQAFKRGLSDWGGNAGVDYVRLALGSKSGEITMGIPADGDDEKTSRYNPIPTRGHDWTIIKTAEKITVPVVRFDEWAGEHPEILEQPYGTLVVDVQGMELEVLEGFGVYLQAFDYLCVELSEKPMYDGEPAAAEVIAWLAEQGFKQETPVEAHDDVCFSRT
jgi:FkbM family methyltransferase